MLLVFFSDYNLNYLSLRVWIGLWISLVLLVMVAFDLSALVRYITRFTEESFASLIALIFIVEAFKKLFHILDHNAINLHPEDKLDYNCFCGPKNTTNPNYTFPFDQRKFENKTQCLYCMNTISSPVYINNCL